MKIKRFGESNESPPVKQWYELPTGERIACSEHIIDTLWWKWVVAIQVRRADTNEFTVFEFDEPQDIMIY